MNFDYNEEQQLLADSVRRFLQKDYDFESRKKIVGSKEGWSDKVWATMAEMGLTGIPFSTEFGGFGGGAVDLMGVMEAAGDAQRLREHAAPLLLTGDGGPERRQRRRISCDRAGGLGCGGVDRPGRQAAGRADQLRRPHLCVDVADQDHVVDHARDVDRRPVAKRLGEAADTARLLAEVGLCAQVGPGRGNVA